MDSKINFIRINKTDTILHALKKMDKVKRKLLLVFDNEKFFSLLSIGDIQRAIISNIDLTSEIYKILRNELTYSYDNESFEEIRNKMLEFRTECMPILSKSNELVKDHPERCGCFIINN